MLFAMRDKVLAALTDYAEGGTIRAARRKHGISARQFYDALEADPNLVQRYRFIQKSRADMFADEVLEMADEGAVNGTDPRHMRVAADIKLKLAGFYDRPRFGEKIGLELDAGPNLVEAIQAAKQRVALPPRDLDNIIDAESRAITDESEGRTTDKQSEERTSHDLDAAAADPLGLLDDDE